MTPAARVQAAIELLGVIDQDARPADAVANHYFRSRRFIGAKDRRAISERVWGCLRRRARLGWWLTAAGAEDWPRERVLADLVLQDRLTPAELVALFPGEARTAEKLTPPDRRLIATLMGQDLFHHAMPLSVKAEFPAWLEDRLSAQFGDRLGREMAALRDEAPFDLRVNRLKTDRAGAAAALAAQGIEATPTPWSPLGLRVPGRAALAAQAAFQDGLVEVQDEGSQLVALLTDARPGQAVLDLCAGAGGKTLALAAAMHNKGRLVACDTHAGRSDRAILRLKRAGVHNVTRRVLDSDHDKWLKRQTASFDRVLVDAPCSGSGTWRRNPDAKWRLTEDGLDNLVALQSRLLAQAAALVKPGGRLIYATCSLLDCENQRRIEEFLAGHSDFTLVNVPDIWAEVIGGDCPVSGPCLALTPASNGTDGFFAAILQRAGAAPAKRLGTAFAAALLAALAMAPVCAQVMDYGALQELFGEPVTLSATGSPQRVADAPVEMEIITADDIRRSGADNVPDILRQVAGVDVRRYGASDADVGIRGYNAPNSAHVLVLLNGRQIYVDYHSYTAWTTLPVQLEEIRQIEVIKGPNCALFGFNAVSGVINIVTFDPVFDPLDTLVTRVGSQGDRQITAIGTGRWGDQSGLRLSASEHGVHELPPSNQPDSYGPYFRHSFRRTAYAQGRTALPGDLTLAVEADVTQAKQFEMTVGGFPGATAYNTNREKIAIDGLSQLGDLDLNLYRNEVTFQYFPGDNCLTCIAIVNEVKVAQASDLVKFGSDHIVRLTLEYRDNRGYGSAFAGEKLGFALYAMGAMWNWQVAPQLAVTNSLRLDHMLFRYSGPVSPGSLYSAHQYVSSPITEPTFNSAAVYRPTAQDSLRVSIARAVQPPDFYALFPEPVSNDPNYAVGSITAFQGTPNLKPTVIQNYQADLRHYLPQWQSYAQLSVFGMTVRDVLASPGDAGVTDPVTGFGYAGNIGNSRALGGEIAVKGARADGWRWHSGYATVYVADRLTVNHVVAAPDSAIDNQRGTPRHVVTLGLGRSWNALEADLFARWQSRFDDIRVGTGGVTLTRYHIADYVSLDARLGYHIGSGVTLAVSGQQLTQQRLLQDSGPEVDRRVISSATVAF